MCGLTYLMVTCVTVFCPGVTKTNSRPKVKKKLFPKANSPTPTSSKSSMARSELKDVAVSMTKLSCSSTENSSHKAGGGKAAWEEGVDFSGKHSKGVTKGSRGGWAAETGKQGKGGWEEEKDYWGGGGGWEKGKAGWGRGRGKGGWKGGKVQKKKSSLIDGFDSDMSPDFVPYKKRSYSRTYNKVTQPTSVYTQPDQKLRGNPSLSQLVTGGKYQVTAHNMRTSLCGVTCFKRLMMA